MKTQIKRFTNSITPFFLMLITCNLMIGCVSTGNYFRTKKWEDPVKGSMIISDDEYVIVHRRGLSFHLDNAEVNKEEMTISGKRTVIDSLHMNHSNLNLEKKEYNPEKESPGNEVHLYVVDYQENIDSTVVIKLPDIIRMDVNSSASPTNSEYRKGLGTGLLVGGCLLPLTVFGILLISSCPFIYIYDGDNYKLIGEAYPGAVGENMVRHDYLELPGIQVVDSEYIIKITNELQEIQYNDLVELYVVDHPAEMDVIIDENGKVYSFSVPQFPDMAIDDEGEDFLYLVGKKDSATYSFFKETSSDQNFSSINLHFNKPQGIGQGKLILGIKNTVWLDYVFSDFLSNWGNLYDQYQTVQFNQDIKVKENWKINEGIQLGVQAKTKTGWQTIKYIDVQGPLSLRDVVVPLDELDIASDDLEIRLECGYHFWEIDYASVDYSKDIILENNILIVDEAVDESGKDVANLINSQDDNYFIQSEIGSDAVIKFDVKGLKPMKGERSVFLHTKGYYEYVKSYDKQPDLGSATKIFVKGGFSDYAKKKLDLNTVFK